MHFVWATIIIIGLSLLKKKWKKKRTNKQTEIVRKSQTEFVNVNCTRMNNGTYANMHCCLKNEIRFFSPFFWNINCPCLALSIDIFDFVLIDASFHVSKYYFCNPMIWSEMGHQCTSVRRCENSQVPKHHRKQSFLYWTFSSFLVLLLHIEAPIEDATRCTY